jgi:hypothetical protein
MQDAKSNTFFLLWFLRDQLSEVQEVHLEAVEEAQAHDDEPMPGEEEIPALRETQPCPESAEEPMDVEQGPLLADSTEANAVSAVCDMPATSDSLFDEAPVAHEKASHDTETVPAPGPDSRDHVEESRISHPCDDDYTKYQEGPAIDTQMLPGSPEPENPRDSPVHENEGKRKKQNLTRLCSF